MTNGENLVRDLSEVDEELIPEISFENNKQRLRKEKRWLIVTGICATCAVLVVIFSGIIYFLTNGMGLAGGNKGVERQEPDQDLMTTTSEVQSCNALDYSDYYEEKEFEEMKKVVSDSEMLSGMGAKTVEIAEAYKLYSIQNANPVKELTAGNRLTEFVSEEYNWVVILDSRLTIRIALKQSGWEVIGYGSPSETQETMDIGQLKSLNDNLESLKKNGVTIQTVQCVDVPAYHLRLVYVQGENEDYYIPYASREDLTNLTNGKIYTAREIADILERVFQESDI